jgi:hypothetical protein
MLLEPIIESVTKTFGGMGSTLTAVDNILNWVFDTLNGVVRGGILIFESLMRGIETLAGPFQRLSDAIFGTSDATGSFGDTLIQIGAVVGTALEILAEVIGFVIDNAIIPLVEVFTGFVLPVLDSMYQSIRDYLVPILVAAGIAFLAFNAMTIAATVIKFAYVAAMVVATAGMALLAAGVAIVAGAFALLTSPIGLAVVAIAALIVYLKKIGVDFQVVTDGLKYLWSGLQTFFSALKLGFFKVLDALPGVDFGKEIEEEEKKIVEQKAEREKLAAAMSARMDENVAKKAEEKADGGGGFMDDLKGLLGPNAKADANAEAAKKQQADKRRQTVDFRNNKPGKFSGAGAGAGAGSTDSKSEANKSDIKINPNAGPEALLKQFAQKEGSPLAGAEAQKQALVAEAEKKKQQDTAAKEKADADAKKKEEEDIKKKKEEEEKNKKPESAETLLAELNTKMATLLKYTFTVAHNTNENVTATRGLNKNLYKA